jgi:hypothetical protein
MPRFLPLAALLAPVCTVAQDGLCPSWSDPERLGMLDVSVLPEASAVEIPDDGSRLYVMNDGTDPIFDVMHLDGTAGKRVRVTGFRPLDLEDIALGPCGNGQCVFLGDIGDNATRRDTVQIAIIAQRDDYPAEVAPLRIVRARYPDGPLDAEAMAVDANGDLWIVTKTAFRQAAPARVFRLSASALVADAVQTLEFRGEIPTTDLGAGASSRRVATGMDIAPDGRRFVLMTYDVAIELAFAPGDPLPAEWIERKHFRTIALAPLIQTESIAYADGGRAIVYTTESVQGTPAPIFSQACR